MLRLSRKDNEAIIIGDNIRVVVIQGKKGGARIGIEAPPTVKVLREELLPLDARITHHGFEIGDAA